MYRKSIYTKERIVELRGNRIYILENMGNTKDLQRKTGKKLWKSCGPSGVSGPSKFLSSPLPFPL